MTASLRPIALGLLAVLPACGGSSAGAGAARFENRPPVTAVNDRRDVPEKPPTNRFLVGLYPYDVLVHDKMMRALDPGPNRRAANINALGEVPDSTWFTSRLGERVLSPEEIRRGPTRGPDPMDATPFEILRSKGEGAAPGFRIEDARGRKYLLKFDARGEPEYESGAHLIMNRILWALGYNVPQDWLVRVRRRDLVLTEDSELRNFFGFEPMKPADVEAVLATAHRGADGRYRAIASRLVPGEPIGGFPQKGVRPEDPNDVIPHQLRRELRAFKAIFAWLKHTDVKEANTLDTWVEDPTEPGKHYVVHYLIDFGKALGAMTWVQKHRDDGYAHTWDFEYLPQNFFSLGLWRGHWEELRVPRVPGVGLYETRAYLPGEFKVRLPYLPIELADEHDAFWGSKLIMRFSEEQLRAAVEAAEYSDPRAAEYMVYALRYRQQKTARYWFRRTNPLDGFQVEGAPGDHRLCFDDLLLTYDLDPVGDRTEYAASAYDYGGERLAWSGRSRPGADGRACFRGLGPGPSHQGYVIVRVETRRAGYDYDPILVHLAVGGEGALRVIGIFRQ